MTSRETEARKIPHSAAWRNGDPDFPKTTLLVEQEALGNDLEGVATT
jgi:hypothetical protein